MKKPREARENFYSVFFLKWNLMPGGGIIHLAQPGYISARTAGENELTVGNSVFSWNIVDFIDKYLLRRFHSFYTHCDMKFPFISPTVYVI